MPGKTIEIHSYQVLLEKSTMEELKLKTKEDTHKEALRVAVEAFLSAADRKEKAKKDEVK